MALIKSIVAAVILGAAACATRPMPFAPPYFKIPLEVSVSGQHGLIFMQPGTTCALMYFQNTWMCSEHAMLDAYRPPQTGIAIVPKANDAFEANAVAYSNGALRNGAWGVIHSAAVDGGRLERDTGKMKGIEFTFERKVAVHSVQEVPGYPRTFKVYLVDVPTTGGQAPAYFELPPLNDQTACALQLDVNKNWICSQVSRLSPHITNRAIAIVSNYRGPPTAQYFSHSKQPVGTTVVIYAAQSTITEKVQTTGGSFINFVHKSVVSVPHRISAAIQPRNWNMHPAIADLRLRGNPLALKVPVVLDDLSPWVYKMVPGRRNFLLERSYDAVDFARDQGAAILGQGKDTAGRLLYKVVELRAGAVLPDKHRLAAVVIPGNGMKYSPSAFATHAKFYCADSRRCGAQTISYPQHSEYLPPARL